MTLSFHRELLYVLRNLTSKLVDDDSQQFSEWLFTFWVDICNKILLTAYQKWHLSPFPFSWFSENHLKILYAVLSSDLTRLSSDMYGVLSSAKFAISVSLLIMNISQRWILKKRGPTIKTYGTPDFLPCTKFLSVFSPLLLFESQYCTNSSDLLSKP